MDFEVTMKFNDYHDRREFEEMASFSISSGGFIIPCKNFAIYGLPCREQEVFAVDMRFEDPQAYPEPYRSLSQYSKFAAKIPNTKKYLVYDGSRADLIEESPAKAAGYLPIRNGEVDKSPGAESEQGFVLVPDSWALHAQFFNKDYDVIKDALADVTGTRQAALGG